MARGALRGAAAAWAGLIVLQAITTKNGAGAVGGLFGVIDGAVKRALDPSVPAIPDRSTAAGTTDANGNYHPTIPGWLGGGTTTAPGSDTSGQPSNPDVVPYDPPPTGQQNPAYGGGSTNVPDAYIPWPSVPGTSNA